MTMKHSETIDPNLSLDEIADVIGGHEVSVGPLVSLGNDGIDTIAVFDPGKKVAGSTKIVLSNGPVPSGATHIGSGEIFVSGILVPHAVYRVSALPGNPASSGGKKPGL